VQRWRQVAAQTPLRVNSATTPKNESVLKLLCIRADVELGAELEAVLNAELEHELEADLADGLNLSATLSLA
jgi:hypothetical protein